MSRPSLRRRFTGSAVSLARRFSRIALGEQLQVPSILMGLGSQGKAKARRRSVDMGQGADVDPEDLWKRPPPEECEPHSRYKCQLARADLRENRLVIRVLQESISAVMVEFAMVQQTYNGSVWVHVVEADSCHDVDVHLHRYSRRTGARVGDSEHMGHLASRGRSEGV